MVIHQIPPASMSSASNQRIFTPPSTITTSTVGLVSTTPSGLEGRSEADQVSPNLSRTTSGAPQFTPSSTTSDIYQVQDDPDPDIPLPSVERDVLFTTNRPITPSTVYYTPSLSSNSHSTEQAEGDDSDILEIGNIRDLRLTSPDTRSIPQRASRAPSIHVTPSAPPNRPNLSRPSRDDSIVAGVAALRMEAHREASLSATALHESSSPSPSRRRRSGSRIRRERHQVEAEDPPKAFANMAEVQEALTDARNLMRRITTVLSSSSLHHESGSNIQNLYQQATRLENFQLPSSRIVGLVGDSGVGKSSLINSLLDKSELARAVSHRYRLSNTLYLTQRQTEQQWHRLYVCSH
jgi:ABC-type glutathione transport system ATPase component